MMESLRNAAKSWVAKLLIGLLAVSFGVWGIADVFRGFNAGALATVGTQEVSAEQFNRAFNQYIQNVSQQSGQAFTPEEARRAGLDQAVLNNLIQSAAIDNQAIGMKLAVPDSYLARDAMNNPNFKDSTGKFDAAQFKQILNSNRVTEAGYFAQERQNLLRQALTGAADGDYPVSKTLVEAQFRHDNEQRDARYFLLKAADSEIAAPAEAEIKAEYEANPGAYTAPEYRSIAIMKAEPADLAAKVTLSDEDIKAGYEKYKSDYFTPEKRTVLQLSFPTLEEAKAAQAKLKAGTDFLTLAKERGYSEADVTFSDRTRADFVDPAIADAAFKLQQGAVSDPVKGALATVLLKAVTVTPEQQAPLAEVKEPLTARLKLEAARDEIQSIYDAVEDARAAQSKFEDIAAKASIPFQLIASTDPEGRGKDGKELDIPHKDEVLKAAFTSDVGVENDAVSLDEGYVWYEVREVVPSAVKPFDAVKEQARNQVVASKVRALSEDKAKKFVERAVAGAKIEELAKEAGAAVQSAQGIKRNESDGDFGAAAVDALFAVPENGFAYAVEPDGKGAKVMQSQAVLLPAFDAGSAEAKAITDRMKNAAANDLLTAYLGALQKNAGVSINETLWRQIAGNQTQ